MHMVQIRAWSQVSQIKHFTALVLYMHSPGGEQAFGMLTSLWTRATTWGWLVRQYTVQVNTAAVVSCPAISIVIKSSLSCLLLICNQARKGGLTMD